MDTDRIAGKAKETFGKAEAAVGDAVGDTDTEARGRVRQATGAAQNLYGQAKDAAREGYDQARDAVSDNFPDIGDTAERAIHSLEREVKARPLIALLIAALVGFVIAQLTTR